MDPVAIVQVQELECCKLIVSDDTAKQIGRFNHSVVTLVADKLWL